MLLGFVPRIFQTQSLDRKISLLYFQPFFKEIYFTDSIYSVYKDKLQNFSFNQFEYILNNNIYLLQLSCYKTWNWLI